MKESSKKKQHKFIYIDLLLHNEVQETILVDKKFEAPGNNWHIERRGTSYFLIENYMEGILVQDVEEFYEVGDWKYHIYWDERKSGDYFSISDMFSFSYWSYISIIYFCAFLGIAWIQSLPYPETSQIAVGSGGTVALNYGTGVVTGTATTFGNIGAAKTGDVIRFGDRDGTYMGDAIIVGIASTTQLTIGSTMGLSGVAIAGTSFTISELPKYSVKDVKFSEASWGTNDSFVYGVAAAGAESASGGQYEAGVGWVGVTTYSDTHGNLRVKKEVLVAMSGITTGNAPAYPPA